MVVLDDGELTDRLTSPHRSAGGQAADDPRRKRGVDHERHSGPRAAGGLGGGDGLAGRGELGGRAAKLTVSPKTSGAACDDHAAEMKPIRTASFDRGRRAAPSPSDGSRGGVGCAVGVAEDRHRAVAGVL